jgi:hypothetical protein
MDHITRGPRRLSQKISGNSSMLLWDDNRLGLVFYNLATSTTSLPSDELDRCEVSVLDFYLDMEPSSEDIVQACGLCRLEP